MSSEFINITILGVDDAESYRRSGGFWEKVFVLSSAPPAGWIAIFDQLWAEAEFFPKRHAHIERDRLVFVCLEEELAGYQMDAVSNAMAVANTTYRQRSVT